MAKESAYGTVLEMGDGETLETFTAVAFITNIAGISLTADYEDVTTHDQAEKWEEILPTIKRTGETSVSIIYDPGEETHDAATGLQERINSGTETNFKIKFPDTTTYLFSAFVTRFEPQAPVAGALRAEVGLKPTGEPTLV